MKTILIFGAGKSATVLINYLLSKSQQKNWRVMVVDGNLTLAQSKIAGFANAAALLFDINNTEKRKQVVEQADIVISMLPPALHHLVAQDCIICKKNLLTASYIDEKIKSLQSKIEKNGLLFLCEMGLDPGIDHMSAMRLIHQIQNQGGVITSFKSHCGGLVAPESDDNPWHYKISWNPQNIVNAGKTGAVYKEHNQIIQKDCDSIFENCDSINIPSIGTLAYYPNRDSLSYIDLYGLKYIPTFIRTTLRHPNFFKGWQYIIKAGLTDSNENETLKNFSNKNVINWFMGCLNFYTKSATFNDFINKYVPPQDHSLIATLFLYLGLMSDELILPQHHSSAQILQYLLERKLQLNKGDKDMIVMLHELEYEIGAKKRSVKSYLTVKGDGDKSTAMATTVGMPLAIATELILDKKLLIKGLHIPIIKDIYAPVLTKLEENNIKFKEISMP